MSDSISLNDFKKSLEAGKYKKLVGARRAVGKFKGWSDATKDSANKLINIHFKVADKPAKEPKRRGRPPGSGKKTASAKLAPKAKATRGRPKRTPVSSPTAASASVGDVGASGEKKLTLAELAHLVTTVAEAVRTIKECKSLTGNTDDVDTELGESVKLLGRATQLLSSFVSPIVDSAATANGKAEATPVEPIVAPKRRGRKPKQVNGNGNGATEVPVEDSLPVEILSSMSDTEEEAVVS